MMEMKQSLEAFVHQLSQFFSEQLFLVCCPKRSFPRGENWSISHSGDFSFVLSWASTRSFGLDVEDEKELRGEAVHLFLSDKELTMLADQKIQIELVQLWTIKEALFKAQEISQSDLFEYEILNWDQFTGQARHLPSQKQFRFYSKKVDGRYYSVAEAC